MQKKTLYLGAPTRKSPALITPFPPTPNVFEGVQDVVDVVQNFDLQGNAGGHHRLAALPEKDCVSFCLAREPNVSDILVRI